MDAGDCEGAQSMNRYTRWPFVNFVHNPYIFIWKKEEKMVFIPPNCVRFLRKFESIGCVSFRNGWKKEELNRRWWLFVDFVRAQGIAPMAISCARARYMRRTKHGNNHRHWRRHAICNNEAISMLARVVHLAAIVSSFYESIFTMTINRGRQDANKQRAVQFILLFTNDWGNDVKQKGKKTHQFW